MKYCLAFIFPVFIPQIVFGADPSWEWVKTSKGKSTNSIVWELKKLNFFKSELPTFKEDFGFEKKRKKSSLDEALMIVLGGPPDGSISPDEDSIVLTACRSHSCDEKGFYWANSKNKTSAMAIVHFVFQGKYSRNTQLFMASKNFNCREYPESVMAQIKTWLKSKNLNPKKTRCLQDGHVVDSKI